RRDEEDREERREPDGSSWTHSHLRGRASSAPTRWRLPGPRALAPGPSKLGPYTMEIARAARVGSGAEQARPLHATVAAACTGGVCPAPSGLATAAVLILYPPGVTLMRTIERALAGACVVCALLLLPVATPSAQKATILPLLDHIHLNVPDQAKGVEWYQ